jgi:hypothetical protein
MFDVNIIKGFGSSFDGFKSTNPHLDTKKHLVSLYWQVYGTNQVTNNEYMNWFVKGYIAQKKGKNVNWAKAAIFTAHEKAQRKEVRMMKSRSM